MGIRDIVARYTKRIGRGTPSRMTGTWDGIPITFTVMGDSEGDPTNMSVAQLWATQPHLRTVVDYIASNIAQLGMHVFQTDNTGDRDRVRGGDLVGLLKTPNPDQTLAEFMRSLVTQMALYNDAYVWVLPGGASYQLRVIPNDWVSVETNAFGTPKHYSFSAADGASVIVPPDEVLRFPGWSPDDPAIATSPVETLRLILQEQHHAAVFRQQIWKKQGRFGGYIYRPKDAPAWTDHDRRRFDEMLKDFTSDTGARAGENPLLEDGMEYKRTGFSAKEEQWAESTKISLETVCQVYHVPPVMVGITDDANYSNVTAYARQLYTNTLGSWIVAIEQRFNAFLLPMLGVDSNHFVEFNVEAKLRGDFAEQYKILQTAVGAPILTRNEARRMLNYKPAEGGDELVTPLNVLIGGQASPTDAGDGRPEEPDTVPEPERAAREVISKTFRRVERSVRPKKMAGVTDWWDEARWKKELTHDLEQAGITDAEELAATTVNQWHKQFLR